MTASFACFGRPKCESSPGGCVPMHKTLATLKAYHARLNLAVGHYHLDPFWWSQRPYGGCEDGATAINMSASPFHFPEGLGAVGLEMQLIIKYINGENNIYMPEYQFDGNQVAGNDSARFYKLYFANLYNTSNLRSLVWDGLDAVWASSDERVTTVTAQTAWHKGFADAALEFGLPMRVDMSVRQSSLKYIFDYFSFFFSSFFSFFFWRGGIPITPLHFTLSPNV